VSDDEHRDGPPGPDQPELDFDAEEVIPVEDNYKRRNEGAKLASLLNDVCGEMVIDASKYTDAWWDARERELADERAKHTARIESDRMRQRLEFLVHTEGMAGPRCRFPRWAVESARKLSIETEAIRHSRRFLHAAELERLANVSRLLGERDHDDEPTTRAAIFLVLAGGTGGGKTTAASWLALKSHDDMPGFIRASELERRGRYDKDLRTWIPERTSLVIDDIGAEVLDGKGVFRSFLDEIVDDFYSSRRRLIMTTNLAPKITDEHRAQCAKEARDPEPQFRERYGDRVRSRVIQVGQWAECGNKDLRAC